MTSTPASDPTMNCQTPCCGRFTPRIAIVGHKKSATTTSLVDAIAAGSTSQPATRAAISRPKMREAAAAHRAAGTAVDPRTR